MYKIVPIRFLGIVNYSIKKYFDNHQNDVIVENNVYILPNSSKIDIRKELLKYTVEYLETLTRMNDVFYFVVDSCAPNCNCRLDGVTEKYVYKLVEDDVKINEAVFNSAFSWIFNHFFAKYKTTLKQLNNHIRFIKNKNLDSTTIIDIIKSMYGQAVVSNDLEEHPMTDYNLGLEYSRNIWSPLELQQFIEAQLKDMALGNG